MNRSRRNPVWFVLAWAAVVAQAAPLSLCRDCERPCCAAREAPAGKAAADEVDTCPACAAAEATACGAADAALETASSGRPTGEPCRCRLDTRPEQPLAAARGNSPRVIGCDAAIAALAASPPAPPALGASREYLAATLAMPIRPPRILYGVWRN